MSMTNQNTAKESTANKNVNAYRVIAAIIAIACVVAFFVPLQVLTANAQGFALEEKALFGVLGSLVKSDTRLYGLLPTLATDSTIGMAATYALYLFIVTVFVSFILAIVALFLKDKAPVLAKWATFLFTWGAAIYSISILVITSYLWDTVPFSADAWTIVLSVLGAILYFAMMYMNFQKAAFAKAGQFLLSLVAAAFLFLGMSHNGLNINAALSTSAAYKSLMVIAAVFVLAGLVLATLMADSNCEKGIYVELGRILVQATMSLCIIFINYGARMTHRSLVFFALAGAVVSFVQVVIVSIQLIAYNKKAARKELDDFIKTFAKEECVEVYPYDGSPVAGVKMAEAVAPAAAPAQAASTAADVAPAAPASNQVYDPFIASLTDEERNEFTDLYILKSKVQMPEIPTYEVGGNNKDFFKKVFIYLGQYRGYIPNELLGKMYDYSMKI